MLTKEIYETYMTYNSKWLDVEGEIDHLEDLFYYADDVDVDMSKLESLKKELSDLQTKISTIEQLLEMTGEQIVMEGGELYGIYNGENI